MDSMTTSLAGQLRSKALLFDLISVTDNSESGHRSIVASVNGQQIHYGSSALTSIEKSLDDLRNDYRHALAQAMDDAKESEKELDLTGITLKHFEQDKGGQKLGLFKLRADLPCLIDRHRKTVKYPPTHICFAGHRFSLKSKEAQILAKALNLPSWPEVIAKAEKLHTTQP